MQQREPRARLGAAPRRIAEGPRGLHLPESRCSNGGPGAGGRAYDRTRLPSRSSHVPPGSSSLCTESILRNCPFGRRFLFGLNENGGAERLSTAVAQYRGEVYTCQLCARRTSGMAHPCMRSCLFFTPRRFDPGDEAAGGSRLVVVTGSRSPALTVPSHTDRAPRHRSSRRYRSRSSMRPSVVSPLAKEEPTAFYTETTFIPGVCLEGRLDESDSNSRLLYRTRLPSL